MLGSKSALFYPSLATKKALTVDEGLPIGKAYVTKTLTSGRIAQVERWPISWSPSAVCIRTDSPGDHWEAGSSPSSFRLELLGKHDDI